MLFVELGVTLSFKFKRMVYHRMKKPLFKMIMSTFFDQWLLVQSEKSKHQIDGRLILIKYYGHFGDHKVVDKQNHLGAEMEKWKTYIFWSHR